MVTLPLSALSIADTGLPRESAGFRTSPETPRESYRLALAFPAVRV